MILRTLLGGLLLAFSVVAMAAEYEAALGWFKRVDLATLVSGVVAEVNVQPGQIVKEGQLLLRLDSRGFRADVVNAEAALKKLGLLREESRRELERAQELYDRTLLSDHDLQVAIIGESEAEAAYQRANANLTAARLNLEYSQIKAPFNGVILASYAEQGESINNQFESRALLSIAATGTMRARAKLSESQIKGITLGDSAKVIADGLEFPGKVTGVGFEADTDGHFMLDIAFELKNEALLRAGQRARIILP